jgi:hypothetical protein
VVALKNKGKLYCCSKLYEKKAEEHAPNLLGTKNIVWLRKIHFGNKKSFFSKPKGLRGTKSDDLAKLCTSGQGIKVQR